MGSNVAGRFATTGEPSTSRKASSALCGRAIPVSTQVVWKSMRLAPQPRRTAPAARSGRTAAIPSLGLLGTSAAAAPARRNREAGPGCTPIA